MNANRKVVLIIMLGVGACLLSFVLSQYYSSKYHDNQVLLSRIQQISGRINHIQLLGKSFIQNGDEGSWLKIIENIEDVRLELGRTPDAAPDWHQELADLGSNIDAYHQVLTRIHDPAVRLNAEKEKLEGIGLSFSKEVETAIITPYRQEEGLRIYQGASIDPFKTRIKDTAYDLIDLHLRQQLILLQLLLDWDLNGYLLKKQDISKALEKHKAQLRYMNVLMGDTRQFREIIDSLDQKLTRLVSNEQVIIEHFTTLNTLTKSLNSAGEKLLAASRDLSNKIVSDTSRANQANRFLNWGLLVGILGALGLLGAMLARDVIRFVEELKDSRESLKTSENNLKVTLNSIGDAVIATDDKGVITRMNPAAERLTGWSAIEATGRQLPEVFCIVDTHTRQKSTNPVDKVLAEGKRLELSNHSMLISKNGAERQIAHSGAPIRQTNGEIVGVVLVFRDVTATYAQEQKIRANEELLKDITANVPGVVYQFQSTRDHKYTNSFVSEKSYELFGLDPEPSAFLTQFNAHIPEKDKDRFNASIRKAVDNVLPWHYEGPFIKPSGEIIWFYGHSIPRIMGEHVVFYGVLMDITERKQLEKELRLAQFCFDKASIGIFRIGAEAQIIDVNEQGCRNLGYTREELCNMTVFDIDPTFNAQIWPDHIEKLRKQKTHTIEAWHKHKNGKVFPVGIHMNIMEFEGQEFHLAYVQDISERKRWQSDMEASERRFKDLFNEAPVMYVITETRDGQPYIADVNNLFLETLGYSRQEIIGTPLASYYTSDSCRELLDRGGYQRALKGQFMAAERSFVASDGRDVHTLLHALPEKDAQGRVVGTRAMFLDITSRKQAEQETKRLEAALAQSQKLEAIGTLAGGIAHDFNNILSAVVGYAELSLNEAHSDSRLHYNLQQIYAAGMRASKLVRQILTFSRKAERELRPLKVGPLIKEAIRLLRSSVPSTIEIDQAISSETDYVKADPTQIHQIVMNLCTNAAQSMEDTGGRMTISLDQVHIAAEETRNHPGLKAGDFVKFTVEDTGRGIAPENMEMIFNPYFTTKEEGKGTGLGLSVVHGIVKSYDGFVYVESEPNCKTTFTVLLPAMKQPHHQPPREKPKLPRGRETILLVDDESTLIEVGRQTLEMLGYKVLTCQDGVEALKRFRQSPQAIDLVISDVNMPRMAGDKLAEQLMQIRPDLPIILYTGFSSKLSKKSAADIGVKALLTKPLIVEELAAVTRNVLDEAARTSNSAMK